MARNPYVIPSVLAAVIGVIFGVVVLLLWWLHRMKKRLKGKDSFSLAPRRRTIVQEKIPGFSIPPLTIALPVQKAISVGEIFRDPERGSEKASLSYQKSGELPEIPWSPDVVNQHKAIVRSHAGSVSLKSINTPPAQRSKTAETGVRFGSQRSKQRGRRASEVSRRRLSSANLGKLEFAMFYNSSTRDFEVTVVEVKDFLPEDVEVHPFILLELAPSQWEGKTATRSGKDLALFNEMFIISGFSHNKIRECSLRFRLVDEDSGIVLGELVSPLSDLQANTLTNRSCGLQSLHMPNVSDTSLGVLVVSLRYNPVDQRIEVRVIRAENLPKVKTKEIDTYIKAKLFFTGTLIQEKKTRTLQHTQSPEYDELLEFTGTPPDKMDQLTLAIKVKCVNRLGRNQTLGEVVLGCAEISESGHDHWQQIIDKPHLDIEQSHEIQKHSGTF